MKKVMSLIIAGGVLATSIPVFASTVRNISSGYTTNKLIVNGIDTGEAFINQGITYVPLKTISDALGQEIRWDSNTKAIYVNSNNNSANVEYPTDIPSANVEYPTDIPAVSTQVVPTPVVSTPVVSTPVVSTPAVSGGTWHGQKIISMATAESAALKAVGGGTVIKREADIYDYDDLPDYEFKILKGGIIYEVEINGLTGAVMDFDID